MNRKFIGSTIALIIGIIAFLGAITQIANGSGYSDPLGGLLTILGALAYRSLKKRKLGIIKSTNFGKGLEVIALLLIILLVVLQNNLQTRIITNPISNIIIPLWAFIAYFILLNKQQEETNLKNQQSE